MTFNPRHKMYVVLAVFLSVAACNYNQGITDGGLPTPGNNCTVDEDCRDKQRCVDSICVTKFHTPIEAALEIAPVYGEVSQTGDEDEVADGGGIKSANISVQPVGSVVPITIDGPKNLNRIDIPLLVEVSGNVKAKDGTRVPAKINFIPMIEDIEKVKKPKVITATTLMQDEEVNTYIDSKGMSAHYIAHVLQNETYSVFVQPIKDESTNQYPNLPPYVIEGFQATESPVTRLDFSYRNLDIKTRSYRMTLSNLQGDLPLEVFAIDRDKPDTIISSRQIITAQNGVLSGFDLSFISLETPYQLVIKPVEPSEEDLEDSLNSENDPPVYPVFTLEGDDLDAEAVKADNTGIYHNGKHSFIIPPIPGVITFAGTVRLCDQPSNKQTVLKEEREVSTDPPTDLSVALYSKELYITDSKVTPAGTYTTQTSARDLIDSKEFRFTIQLLPGKYEIVISPPTGSSCSILAQEISIDNQTENHMLFQMSPRVYIEGSLWTANGDPVFGATIQAQALGRQDPENSDGVTVTRFNLSNQTTTSEEGLFSLPVDLGSYDIIAKPPVATSFGWKVIRDVRINKDDENVFHNIKLEAPVPIEGTLDYAYEKDTLEPTTGFEGAEIRVFAVIDDIGSDEGFKRTIAIGRATADKDGLFKLLISPSIQSWQ